MAFDPSTPAAPRGGLISAEAPLIDAESLFRQAGPALLIRPNIRLSNMDTVFLTRFGSISDLVNGVWSISKSPYGLITIGQGAAMASVVNPLQVSRFLKVYDEAAARKGIRLSIGFDFQKYVSITRNMPTKGRTYPNFRPDRSPIKSGEGYWTIGLDKNNKVALLQAARLYDLSRSNFAEHLQSLNAFYADPTIHAHPQDRCICTAPSAKKMTGKVAYHGDLWVRRDYRGQGIPKIMAGISHGVSFAMWAPDFMCGLVARWSLDKGIVAQYETPHHEPGGSILQLLEEDIVDDDWLIWTTGEEVRRRVDHHDGSELLLAP